MIRVPLPDFGENRAGYSAGTDARAVVLANGGPAETFVDNVSRRAFDNFAEFEEFLGENPPEILEPPYPRAANARHLPDRIGSRMGIGAKRESAA